MRACWAVGRTSGLRSALSGFFLLAGCDGQGVLVRRTEQGCLLRAGVTVCCTCAILFAGDGCVGVGTCCVPGFAAMLIGDVTAP
jgi:hypothetical protein